MSYTIATMEVSKSCFDEIKQKLKEAGYEHAILEEDGSEMLDMTHIGLVEGK